MLKSRTIAVIAILLVTGGLLAETQRSKTATASGKPFFPKLGNYADLYLRGSYDILHMVKIREMGKVGAAAKIAAQRKLAGGTIYSHISTPHIMYAGACDENAPGNPNIAPDYSTHSPLHGKVPALGAGDFLMISDPGFQDRRKRGCFILGIGYPMSTNRYSPPQYNDHPQAAMETQTDMMIYTWGPKEDGLVTPRLTPHLKICPTSPMTVLGYWIVTAQIASNLAHQDTSGTFEAAETYLDTLMNRLQVFHERYLGDVNVIGRQMAEKILSGGKLYPWSTRWEFYQEAAGTAGSLMGIYPNHPDGFYTGPGPMNPPAFNPEDLTPKDVVILAATANTPREELEMAKRIKAKGAMLVGIFPFKREDGFSTAPLRKLCDWSLDNFSGDHYGVLSVPGYDTKIIPTMALMNNYAWWAIVGAYVQAMEDRNVAPYYWMSWHVPHGKAYTDSIHPYFMKRGY